MSDAFDLLQQYIAAHQAGDSDPMPFLEQAGDQRPQLVALIDFYLEQAPPREWDAEAYANSPLPDLVDAISVSVQGQSGLWPALLPRLRKRAQMKRSDLVAELAQRLGAQNKQEKVGDYYHEMEQGLLPARGVNDKVLDALGKIVGESRDALRQAGEAIAPGPGPAAGAAYARMSRAPNEEAAAPASPGAARAEAEIGRGRPPVYGRLSKSQLVATKPTSWHASRPTRLPLPARRRRGR